ncbi:MAG: AbrB/MazE/SpoVT family DNA-binding domain-containing protein [Verrucomicrobia bacterium]|nr:MAG: AbrB/MazE/SpoVT family DNA-binding domain-containing protein [Verrucomicrobiota bacterium]
MRTVLQKWGNSLALRIRRAYANEIAVAEGQAVDVRVIRGRLVIAPVVGKTYELADLVADITSKNRHVGTDTSKSLGKEVW